MEELKNIVGSFNFENDNNNIIKKENEDVKDNLRYNNNIYENN